MTDSDLASHTNPVLLPERLTREWIESCSLPKGKPEGTLKLDFRQTRTVDSAGISLVHFLNNQYKRAGQKLVLCNISDDLLMTLKRWAVAPLEEPVPVKSETWGQIKRRFIDRP